MNSIKKKYVYFFAIILLIAIFFCVSRWNDYREKELVDVLDVGKIEEIHYRKLPLETNNVMFNRTINDPKLIQELADFFSQYKVKKVRGGIFTSKYPGEQFTFELDYTDKRNTLPSLIERDVFLEGFDQYTITNGPFDYKWIKDFIERLE